MRCDRIGAVSTGGGVSGDLLAAMRSDGCREPEPEAWDGGLLPTAGYGPGLGRGGRNCASGGHPEYQLPALLWCRWYSPR